MEHRDADAFAVAFIAKYRRVIWSVIIKEGVRDMDQKDLYQMASMRFLDLARRGLLRDEGGSSVVSFVAYAVRNLCRTHYRSNSRHRGHLDASIYEPRGTLIDPQQQVIRSDDHGRLREHVDVLSEPLKEVMVLRLAGLEPIEIADHLGVTHLTIKMRSHKAIKQLRRNYISAAA